MIGLLQALSGSRDGPRFRLRRGLDIALPGAPRQAEGAAPEIATVGLMAADCRGLRPAMKVAVGDRVAAGDPVFTDRRRPDIAATAPIAGTVTRVIGRGTAAGSQAVEIQRDGGDLRQFETPPGAPTADGVRSLLLQSGLWTALRERPFDRIIDPDATADAIFISAMASDPLAADAAAIIAGSQDDFAAGVEGLALLTDGPVHVCQAPGPPLAPGAVIFDGPHPAGLPGTHIHMLCPVDGGRRVWHIGYQDVIAAGRLLSGRGLWSERIIALAGPGVAEPRLCRVPLGADLGELTAGALHGGDMRVVSGSVLSGTRAPYLGRYHLQATVLPEGWDAPQGTLLSPTVSTALGGAAGPLLPVAALDRAMPLDIPAVPLLRALSVGDRDAALRLGCLGLVEEDLALLSYLCPGRGDYGRLLRAVLDEIEADG